VPIRLETMKTQPRTRQVAWAMGFATIVGFSSAHADIYTWVDASGRLNLSNREPPEGARVTSVYREDPAARASAEAARAAAQRDEVKALNERVTQLQRDVDAANERPAPAPIVYTLPAPAPAPPAYPQVIAQTIVAPSAPAYDGCADWWSNCFAPGYFLYPGSVVVLNAPGHRFRPVERRPRGMMPPPTRAFAQPVGALPDPVNLFPGTPRH
jgi:hypothetical protein